MTETIKGVVSGVNMKCKVNGEEVPESKGNTENGAGFTDEQKKELQEKLDSLKAVYNVKDDERNLEDIENASKALNEAWFKISSEVSQKMQAEQAETHDAFVKEDSSEK